MSKGSTSTFLKKKKKKESRFIAFADFHDVNTTTVANFNLVMTSVNAELRKQG